MGQTQPEARAARSAVVFPVGLLSPWNADMQRKLVKSLAVGAGILASTLFVLIAGQCAYERSDPAQIVEPVSDEPDLLDAQDAFNDAKSLPAQPERNASRVRVVVPPAQQNRTPVAADNPSQKKNAAADNGDTSPDEITRKSDQPADSPERESLKKTFRKTANQNVMECMVLMAQSGVSFRGELAFDVRGESIDEGMVDFRVDSLEVRPGDALTAQDMPDATIECLDQSINSLVAELPQDAESLFADGAEPHFKTKLRLDLRGAEKP